MKRIHVVNGDRATDVHSVGRVETTWSLRDFLREVSIHGVKHLTVQHPASRCYWRGEPWNCKVLFTEIQTGDGICCGFNGRSIYDQDIIEPLLITSGSTSSGLVIVVSHTESPTSVDLGYKWEQERFYEVKSNGTAISRGYEYFFGHHTHRLVSAPSVVQLEKPLRSCVEQNENPLKYFPVYDRWYCKAECEVEATLARCGCVLYTSPVRAGSPFCRASSLACAQRAAAMANCDCPESCEFSVSRMSTNVLYLVPPEYVVLYDNIYDGLDPQKMSVVRVFGPDTRAEVVHRRECYFTYFNLISQFGGVFGVYLGCSFISAVELLFLAWRTLPGLLRKTTNKRASRQKGKKT